MGMKADAAVYCESGMATSNEALLGSLAGGVVSSGGGVVFVKSGELLSMRARREGGRPVAWEENRKLLNVIGSECELRGEA